MRGFAIASLTVIRPRPLHVALVLALLCPGQVLAAPPSVDVGELRERAEALDAEGHYADAATAWENFAGAAVDLDQRMLGTMHAFHAWMLAYESSGEEAYQTSARSILLRALDDPQLDAGWREELQAAVDKIEAPRVALLDPKGEPHVDRPASAPIVDRASALGPVPDAPRRDPYRIAGGVSLVLAAPALGCLIYALARDARITGQLEFYEAMDKSSVDDDDKANVERLGAEGFRVRNLAIAFGTTSTVLVGVAVGLLVHARRRPPTRALALLPDARPGLAGVALRGRF